MHAGIMATVIMMVAMGLSNIELLQTQDGDVNQLQINIKKVLTPLINNPLLAGNTMSVDLKTGDNQIAHGLNRTLLGWVIVDIDGASVIYRNGKLNPSQILTLNSSAAVNVSLYVF